MAESRLLIVSPNETWRESLLDWIPANIVCEVVSRTPAMPVEAGTPSPRWLLLDLRQCSAGGHAEERWLAQVRHRSPLAELVILVDDECPETVERRAAVDRMQVWRSFRPEQLTTWVGGQSVPQRMASVVAAGGSVSAGSVAPDHSSSVMLPGLVRSPGESTANRVDHTSPIVTAFRATHRSLENPPRQSTSTAAGPLNAANVASPMMRRFETQSPALQKMLHDLETAARHNVTILLIGETGAGKTFLSRLIHEISPRRTEPFLPVACGALPNDLIESELFGHSKGSFTSAHADKEGKFVAARKGSLLLDEIDVLGLEQQVKLLRVIETGEFEPVGSNATMHCQARLIVASNLELQPLVEQGRFRADLYYRLNMMKFVLPPLRNRRMDIVPLARKFVQQFCLKHDVSIHATSPDFLQHLIDYPWPGNVRELEHVIQRAVIYCRDGELQTSHLPEHIMRGEYGPTNDPSVVLGGQSSDKEQSLGRQIALTEREIIEQALFKNSFSRTRTAKDLGISRVTLYNKMKRYGISH